MINNTISKMQEVIDSLLKCIEEDLQDIRSAKHESLMNRNAKKEKLMRELQETRASLAHLLQGAVKNGEDVEKYRVSINQVEENLKKLHKENSKLAAVVIPVKEMYQELMDEVKNSGQINIMDIKA